MSEMRLFSPAGWSLAARLSICFALCSGALTATMGYVFYREHVREMREEHVAQLAQRVEVVRQKLTGARNENLLAANNESWQEFALPAHPMRMAVFDEHGKVLLAPAAFPVAAAELPPPSALDVIDTSAIIRGADNGRRYHVLTTWADVEGPPPTRTIIAMALDISSSAQHAETYRRTLLATLIAVIACAALLGYLIARRGLAPLRSIVGATNEITSAHLDRRLKLAGAPAELRELATAFNAMLDRLGESFTRLSQFSSDLAHELRRPLTNLLGEAQVSLARARSADEYRDVIESGVEELERLARMIENMLFLARAERPETTISSASFDARAELEKVADFYRIMAEETGVAIHCAGDGEVYADAALVRRAVGNLLSNALRHTAASGEISMRVTVDPGGASIAVANPGPPVPPEHHAGIFERFYRVDQSCSRSGESTGLGLAIVQTIMRLHRGTVTLSRSVTEANIFTLRFPPPGASA